MSEEKLKKEIKGEIINQILFKDDESFYTINNDINNQKIIEASKESFLKIKEEESKIYDIIESLSKNIVFYKKFIKQGNQYSFSSDCHGDLYALLSALLSSGVVDLDKFEKNIENIEDAIIFIDRTDTTGESQTMTFKKFKEKFNEEKDKTKQAINLEDFAELAKYIPIPNIPLKKEEKEKYKYINMGDNVDRGSLSNVCHIFAQYLSSEGLFFIDGNHEKFYKINDVDDIALNGGQLPPCTKSDKNIEQYSIAQLDKAAQNYFYDIVKKCSEDIARSDRKPYDMDKKYSKYKNKLGIPNIGTIAESGNVIVYPLPLSSITVRDGIPEYYVSIINNEETFTVSVNANREIEVSKINEKNIDEKLSSRYKEKIPLKDRKNIIQNLLLCYQYDNANYLGENIDKIKETKKIIIGVLETELNKLSNEEKEEKQKKKKQEKIKLIKKKDKKTPKRIKIRKCPGSFNLELNSDLLENKNQEEERQEKEKQEEIKLINEKDQHICIKNQEEKKEEIKLKKSPEPSEKNTTEYEKICGKTPGSTLSTKKQEEKQKQGSQTEFNKKIAYFKNKEYEKEEKNKVEQEKLKIQNKNEVFDFWRKLEKESKSEVKRVKEEDKKKQNKTPKTSIKNIL